MVDFSHSLCVVIFLHFSQLIHKRIENLFVDEAHVWLLVDLVAIALELP